MPLALLLLIPAIKALLLRWHNMKDTKAKDAASRAAILQKIAYDTAKEKAWREHVRNSTQIYEPTNLDRYEDGMQGRYQGWYH
jgi:hypothetical protein